jgi:hypothetical protein
MMVLPVRIEHAQTSEIAKPMKNGCIACSSGAGGGGFLLCHRDCHRTTKYQL